MSKDTKRKSKFINAIALLLAVIFLGIGCIYCGIVLFAHTDNSITQNETVIVDNDIEDLNHNLYVSTNVVSNMLEKVSCAVYLGFGFTFLLFFLNRREK